MKNKNTIIHLPKSQPRIEKAVIPINWKPNCTIAVNSFFNKVSNSVSERYN
jgi:hypothetical protein